MNINKITWVMLRLVMGAIFLWAFVDKLFGLGYATISGNAWINGGSPTTGFLTNATQGPLEEVFKSMAGVVAIDWLFMTGLLFIGVTLIINRFVFWGSLAGILMMLLMWIAIFPPENNPFVDEHIVYALVLALFASRSRGAE
ncbi:MAG: hypothetical protein ACYCY6_02615 [Minisyncoccota bacterium]